MNGLVVQQWNNGSGPARSSRSSSFPSPSLLPVSLFLLGLLPAASRCCWITTEPTGFSSASQALWMNARLFSQYTGMQTSREEALPPTPLPPPTPPFLHLRYHHPAFQGTASPLIFWGKVSRDLCVPHPVNITNPLIVAPLLLFLWFSDLISFIRQEN